MSSLAIDMGDLLVLVVERTGAADPVQVLVAEGVARVDDVDVETLRPVGALALVMPHGFALVLHGR